MLLYLHFQNICQVWSPAFTVRCHCQGQEKQSVFMHSYTPIYILMTETLQVSLCT